MFVHSWASQGITEDEAELAFCRLKQALLDATTLALPQPRLPCILLTDASDVAVGAVLSQVVDGVERPIAFYSRIMNSAQKLLSR